MTRFWPKWLRVDLLCLGLALVVPMTSLFGQYEGGQMTFIFIFAILALGLNVVMGYAGIFHLGIAGFFGIGAYITGILLVRFYPFQFGFLATLIIATVLTALSGMVLGAPTLRLQGDYVALVTLGFGEVVRYSIRNLEEITNGTRALNPIPPPVLPRWLGTVLGWAGIQSDWGADYRLAYYLCLGFLLLVIFLMENLERSRLGRAWIAIREDELAATCMGIDPSRIKLSAFAMGAGLAGLAGFLYALKLGNTAGPEAFDFNRSIIMICCLIMGGLGSLRGILVGVWILIGFDSVVEPKLDSLIQKSGMKATASEWVRHLAPTWDWLQARLDTWLTLSSWRLIIFGLALILMMRFRPEGLWPSRLLQEELHPKRDKTKAAKAGAM